MFQSQDLTFTGSSNGSLLIDLSNNKIETIFWDDQQLIKEVGGHSTNKPTTIINLKNNPIVCNCSALPLANYLQHVVHLKFEHAHCHEPEWLRNTSLEKIHLPALKCSLKSTHPKANEYCPEGCICEFRPVNLCIIVNCTATGIQTIPQHVPNITEFCVELLFDNNNLTSLDGLSDLLSFSNVTKLSLSFNKLRNIDDLVIPNSLRVSIVINLNPSNLKKKKNQLCKKSFSLLEKKQVFE